MSAAGAGPRVDVHVVRGDTEAARSALLALLADALGVMPEAVAPVAGPHGKPAVPGIHYNLSHTRGIALVALSRDAEVGVDVEAPRPRRRDVVALAARWLPPAAADAVAAAPPERAEAVFLRAWVRHEARLKCLGTGFGGGDEPAADVVVVDLEDPADGAPAALAVRGRVPPEVVVHRG